MTDHIVMFDEPLSKVDLQRVTAGFPEDAMRPNTSAAARDVMTCVYFSKQRLNQHERSAYLVTDAMLAITLKFSSDPQRILEFDQDLIQRCTDWSGVVSRLMSLAAAAEELEVDLDAHRMWMRRETSSLSMAQHAVLPEDLSHHLAEDLDELRGVVKTYIDAHP